MPDVINANQRMIHASRTAASCEQTGELDEQIDVVIVGHVDHGKSTLVGRLLADTGSLPQGKLEEVRARCERNARPFEYAFLLDALKNEQAQGITIDAARCFFRTTRRRYILHDAPGHVEFLKNMVTGAARAAAAFLLIDAHEGIRENSRRHGYILSMLGIRQIAVLVNKMDLVSHSAEAFAAIEEEYRTFLACLGVMPLRFIPVAAFAGENIAVRAGSMPWYGGPTVLEQIDAFAAAVGDEDRPLRLPVQDIYKFTEAGDERRIVAGTIETGRLRPGDRLVFHPSGKSAAVKTIEAFNAPPATAATAERAVGLTLETQIYIRPGELAARADEPQPVVTSRLRANVFWMGHAPMLARRRYKLKLGAARVPVELAGVRNVLDASELASIQGKQQVDRHDVAEIVLETAKPVAFDPSGELEKTSRFVLVDGYEIAGCGIVLAVEEKGEPVLKQAVRRREDGWDRGLVTPAERAVRYRHAGKFVVVVGEPGGYATAVAKALELRLFCREMHACYLGVGNLFGALGAPTGAEVMSREEQVRRLGELARVVTEAGLLFITALEGADAAEIAALATLNEPYELFVVVLGASLADGAPVQKHLPKKPDVGAAAAEIVAALAERGVLQDYQI